MKKTGLMFIFVLQACSLGLGLAKDLSGTSIVVLSDKSYLRVINSLIVDQIMKINKDINSGKITKEYGETLRKRLRAIRKQTMSDQRENESAKLTESQFRQLKYLLDSN